MEDGERHPQLNYLEYDWLGPHLTRNTLGRYILILLEVLMTPTRMVFND